MKATPQIQLPFGKWELLESLMQRVGPQIASSINTQDRTEALEIETAQHCSIHSVANARRGGHFFTGLNDAGRCILQLSDLRLAFRRAGGQLCFR